MKKFNNRMNSDLKPFVFTALTILSLGALVYFCISGTLLSGSENEVNRYSKHMPYKNVATYTGSDMAAHTGEAMPMVSSSMPSLSDIHASSNGGSSMQSTAVSSSSKGSVWSSITSHFTNSFGSGVASGVSVDHSTRKSSDMANYASSTMNPMVSGSKGRSYAANRTANPTVVAIGGPRRISNYGDGDVGDYHGEYNPATKKYWNEDTYEWQTTDPTKKAEDLNEVGTPVGDYPWWAVMLMAVGYCAFVAYRRKRTDAE